MLQVLVTISLIVEACHAAEPPASQWSGDDSKNLTLRQHRTCVENEQYLHKGLCCLNCQAGKETYTFSSYNNLTCNQTWEERVPLYINTCSIHLECRHWFTSCILRVIHQESSASCNQHLKGFPFFKKKRKKRASQAHNLSCRPNDFCKYYVWSGKNALWPEAEKKHERTVSL